MRLIRSPMRCTILWALLATNCTPDNRAVASAFVLAPPISSRRRSHGRWVSSTAAISNHRTPLVATRSRKSLPLILASTQGGNDDSTTTMTTTAWNEELDRILVSPPPPSLAVNDNSNNSHSKGPSNLRRAVTFLKQHSPDGMKLSKSNWDNIFTAIEEVTAAAEENEMPAARTSFPIVSHARQDMTDMYAQLQHTGELKLYGAAAIASSSSNNNAPAAGSTEVPPPLLQEILGLPVSALTPSPTNTLLWAGVAVAVLEGLISLATGVSLNALVLTTLVLVSADRLFLNGAVSESLLKFLAPDIQTKILKHEAGHFLAAYLLGCPVEGTVLSAWAALRDRRFGSRGMISAGTSFFDPELSQQINSSGGSSNGRVTQSSVSRYSIIVMAGIAAEAEHYGQADGGAGDEMALIAFLSRLSNWNGDSQRIRNQARWGVLQAVLLLRQYRPAYDALVDALEQGGNLGDCLYAVERAARQHNLPGAAERQPLGYIVPAKDGRLTWSPTTTGGGDASITAGNNNNDTNHNHNNSEELSFQKQVEVVAAVTPPTPTTAPAPGLVIDQAAADALQTLHEYKLQVEQKLRDVEEKLKRNQQ